MYISVDLTEVTDVSNRVRYVEPHVHIEVDITERYDHIDIETLRETRLNVERVLRQGINNALERGNK